MACSSAGGGRDGKQLADRVPGVRKSGADTGGVGHAGLGGLGAARAGEFALGGCCVPPDFGTVDYWACRACGHQYPVHPLVNDSPVGRLLEEISWEGNARPYRHGGRGWENVLTTEVLTLLDLLPREAFLGAVLVAAHGADQIRRDAAAEAEAMTVSVLPGDVHGVQADGTPTPWSVQPDVRMESWRAAVWVEAKRIRPASFQPHQLARTLHALLTNIDQQVPLLVLVLGTPPPIRVARVGTLDIPEAVEHSLASFDDQQDLLATGAREAVAWITWAELASAVRHAVARLDVPDPSATASVRRMADGVDRAIAWHS